MDSPNRFAKSHEIAGHSQAERLLPVAVVANRLNVSIDLLRKWRGNGSGPPFYVLAGGIVRYPEFDLASWLDVRRQPNALFIEERAA